MSPGPKAHDELRISPGRREQIRAEQVRTLYAQAPFALLSSLLIPALLVGVLWGAVPGARAGAWLAAVCAVAAVRAVLVLAHRRAASDASLVGKWERDYLLGALASGCLWGVAGVLLFVDGALDSQVILGLVLGGMCTGSVASLGAHLRTFYAFAIPTMLPYVARLLAEADRLHVTIALLALFFLVAMCFFARNFHRVLTQSWALRFENIDLVAELTVKKEEAERANIAKSRFLAAASHDLRQPLHAMALFVSALNDKSPEGEARAIAGKLSASVETLEGLFHALLDVSKLDAGVVRPEIRDVRLQALFDRIGSEYAEEAGARQLRLRFAPTRLAVRSDIALLERILRNLVSNGIRYTNDGGVLVGCRRQADTVRIDVLDTGVGISPRHLKDIFQEFYQVGNPERDRNKGLGLGLAIVDRLAHLLNHAIRVSSVPGRGSVFSVTVPLGDRLAAVDGVPRADEFVPAKLDGALVLVIDDEQAVLEGMGEVLQQWGCRPFLANSADEALAQLANSAHPPAAIVADYRLRGGETGVAAIERIRSAYGTGIPGVIVTGDTAPDRLREAEASGYHLLHKPVRPVRLRALLSFLLGA